MSQGGSRRVIAAGAIGNVLEWYDFAVGFLMRPIGGAVIGAIGDRLSRRAALTFSVVAMAIPTFLAAVLPDYETLDIAAPTLLTLLRMVQGLSVGGEYTTSIIFIIEQSPQNRRGLVGALGCCGAISGILLGSATGALCGHPQVRRDLPAGGAGRLES